MGTIVVAILLSILSIPLIWFEGWTAVKMWQWFVIPVFTGVPTFTAWQAASIMLATRMLMPTHSDYFPNEDSEGRIAKAVYNLVYSLATCLSCLVVGWLIKTLAL